MQRFLPTTNTTPGYLALDYFTPGPTPGFDEIRNDKQVKFSIQPVQSNLPGFRNVWIPDYLPGDTFSMAVGNFDTAPTDGVFSLQVGSETAGLADLPYNITAAALKSALDAALTIEGKPLARVLKLSDGNYSITGATNGAITDGFFAVLDSSGLYPISNAFFRKGSNGSPTTPYRYTLTLRQAPMCYGEPTDPLPDADVTVENTQVFDAGQSAIWTVLFTVPQVSGGSFTVNAKANGVDATCGTATPTMSARDFGLMLAQHPEINYATPDTDDNIAVTVSGQTWVVAAIADLATDADFELSVVNSPDDPVIGPMGLSGEINFNTIELYIYSLSQGDTFTLTRQIQRTRGSETRTLVSDQVTIYKELIDASTAVPAPTINYYTASQVNALLALKMDADFGNVDGILGVANGGTGKTIFPKCSVNKGGTAQTVPTDTDTKVTWSTEVYDVGSNFTNNEFTAPTTGFYFISCSIYIQSSVVTVVRIFKDTGGGYSELALLSNINNVSSASGCYVAALNAGDKIAIYATHFGNGGDKDINGAATQTWLQVTTLL